MKKLAFFLFLGVLIGCDGDDETPVCELSKIESYIGTFLDATYNVFSTDGKVSAVQGTINPQLNEKETWLITFDGENMATLFHEIDGASYEEHYKYSYGAGFSTVKYYKISGTDTLAETEIKELYTGMPAADGIYYLDNAFIEVQGENVVRSGNYDVVAGTNVINPNSVVNYTYDNNPNILRHLVRIPGYLNLGFESARINSRNNLLTATYAIDNFKKEYTFNYDNNGNLLNFVDNDTGHQLTFSHKCK